MPILIEFAGGSLLDHSVRFSDGAEILLPSSQVVYQVANDTRVQIGLDGMSFEGVHDNQLVFWHVYLPQKMNSLNDDLFQPLATLRLSIDPKRVRQVRVRGIPVWPEKNTV